MTVYLFAWLLLLVFSCFAVVLLCLVVICGLSGWVLLSVFVVVVCWCEFLIDE